MLTSMHPGAAVLGIGIAAGAPAVADFGSLAQARARLAPTASTSGRTGRTTPAARLTPSGPRHLEGAGEPTHDRATR